MIENKFYLTASILFFFYALLFFTYPKAKTITETINVSIPQTKNKPVETEPNDLECLAKNMYHESKGEGSIGWLAVGMVTMNRVKSKKYPGTVCEVVYQNNGKVYQFSWAGTKKALTKPNKKLYNKIRELALHILIHHEEMHDVTDGALFFHADYVTPWWSKKLNRTTKIGKHIFYTSL